jgi:hypothetical protein
MNHMPNGKLPHPILYTGYRGIEKKTLEIRNLLITSILCITHVEPIFCSHTHPANYGKQKG